MRPESIRKFDMFYLGSIGLSLIATVVGYNTVMAQAEAEAAQSGVTIGSGLVTVSLAVGLLISLLLWYLVARKGFVIAKWVVVLFFVLSLFGVPNSLKSGVSTLEIIALVGVVLQAAAVYFLFQPDAKAWFARDPAADPGDTFD